PVRPAFRARLRSQTTPSPRPSRRNAPLHHRLSHRRRPRRLLHAVHHLRPAHLVDRRRRHHRTAPSHSAAHRHHRIFLQPDRRLHRHCLVRPPTQQSPLRFPPGR